MIRWLQSYLNLRILNRRIAVHKGGLIMLAIVTLACGAAPNVWTRKPWGAVYCNDWTGSRTTDATGKAGTLSNGAAITGTALVLDGVNDFISYPDSDDWTFSTGSTDTPFSISAWVYPTSNTGNRCIVGRYSTGPTAYEYRLDTTNGTTGPEFVLIDNSVVSVLVRRATDKVTLNAWHHIVATYSGSGTVAGMAVYLDGAAPTTTTATTGTYTRMRNTAGAQCIGQVGAANSYFAGSIGSVQILANRVLTPEEVAQILNHGKARIAQGGTP